MNSDNENNGAVDDLEEISKVIKMVEDDPDFNNLLPEIIWSALNFATQVPSATIKEAINFGYNEWVK